MFALPEIFSLSASRTSPIVTFEKILALFNNSSFHRECKMRSASDYDLT